MEDLPSWAYRPFNPIVLIAVAAGQVATVVLGLVVAAIWAGWL